MRCVAISSSSSAARLTAPSEAMAPCTRSISRGQRRLVAERLQLRRQRVDIGVRLGELVGKLLDGERHRLLFEAHLLDLRARGLELLRRGEPRFVGRAQLVGDALLPIARRGERLLGFAARRELPLQRFLDRGPVDRRALRGELREQALLLRRLRGERFAPPLELREPLAAAPLGERGFLRGALGGAHAFAAAREIDLGLVQRVARARRASRSDRAARAAHRRARAQAPPPVRARSSSW